MKEAYYFSHDSNARHDPKITALRSVYGMDGLGRYWVLIEMMREASEYKLSLQGKYTINAYAKQMECKEDEAQEFISDCINEFELFKSDDVNFWSNSLLRRMGKREEVSDKRRQAAEKRWNKPLPDKEIKNNDANALQMECNSDALKESKEKESKEKESKALKELADSQFILFWNLYPNKHGKTNAQKKWSSYYPKLDFEKVMSGTQDYIDFCKATDRPFKDGSTFINQKSWDEEWVIPAQTRNPNKNQGTSGKPILSIVKDGPKSAPPSDEEREKLERMAELLDSDKVSNH